MTPTPDSILASLPDLTTDYHLTSQQIDDYRKNGWILLRDVCTPLEIAQYQPLIVEAAMAHNRENRPLEERDTYGKAFLQVMNLWTVDEAVKKFVLSRRFAHIAAQLMEVDGVRLYHDQALFKEPGGGHTPWHQDQFYWPLDTPKTVTMWMPLIDVTSVMGSMTFADDSQNGGFVPVSEEISDESEAFFDKWVREKGYVCRTSGAMAAGDATFHSGYTLHKAPGNVTDKVREVMTVIYFPDGTKVQNPDNPFRVNDWKSWLGSVPPGQKADSPLNPRLYP